MATPLLAAFRPSEDSDYQGNVNSSRPHLPRPVAHSFTESYSPVQRPLRRRNTRKVKIFQGSVLSVNYPIPTAIRNSIQPKYTVDGDSGEFLELRYTAVTCDPDDFTLKNGYDLRPRMYNRHTELLACITYYNEDKNLLSRSLHAFMKNIRDVTNDKSSAFWYKGGPAWQKVVVCLVMDGMTHCQRGVLDVLETIGIYQPGIHKRDVDGKETVAHLYEYTTQLSVTEDAKLIRPVDDSVHTIPPVQFIVCLKARNSGKINSYRWIYNAFGRILNPEVVIHVDAGTQLDPSSLRNLWMSFYNIKDLGGACGMLDTHHGSSWRRHLQLLNPLIAAQKFEYKAAYQLDRSLESVTGYHSVLPGAFSGYRFRAVMGRPLDEYFHGDPTLRNRLGPRAPVSAFDLNRYLSDDRILAFEVVVKPGQKWRTMLVTTAGARTDIPTTTTSFINQRRRWLNGSFAATIYSLRMFQRVFRSGHNPFRLALFLLQLLHNIAAFVVAWFSLAAFLLTVFVVNDITGSPPADAPVSGFPFGKASPIVNGVIQVIYIFLLIFQFILALGGRPRSHTWAYFVSFATFSFIQLYLLMNLIYLTKRLIDFKLDASGGAKYAYINEYYSDVGSLTVLVTGFSLFGVYIGAAVLWFDPWHLFTCWAQFLFVSSTYVNILNIYAFCNSNDVTWGRKCGAGPPAEDPIPTPAKPKPNADAVVEVEAVDRDQQTIDDAFEQAVRRALGPEDPPAPANGHDDPDEQFNRFRIVLVSTYIFTNFLVCLLVLNDSFDWLHTLGDPYWHKVWFFRIWMWANSSLYMARFAGCLACRARALFTFFFWHK